MDINESKKLMDRMGLNRNPNLEVLKKYSGFSEGHAKPLNESGLNRMLSNLKNGGAIISASKSLTDEGEIPDNLIKDYFGWCEETDKQDPREFIKYYNREKTKELLHELRASLYSYSPVYGGYKSEDGITDLYEPSFVIYCTDKHGEKLDFNTLKNFAIELCKKYRQDSVYIREPNGKACYYDENGTLVGQEGNAGTKINRTEEPYFSSLKKGGVQRFTDDIQFLEEGHGYGNGEWYVNPTPTDYNSRFLTYSGGEIIL